MLIVAKVLHPYSRDLVVSMRRSLFGLHPPDLYHDIEMLGGLRGVEMGEFPGGIEEKSSTDVRLHADRFFEWARRRER